MMLFSLLVAARHQGVSLQPWWGGDPAPTPRPPGQPGLSLLPAGLLLYWQGEHHKCSGSETFEKSLFLNRWPQPPSLSSSWNGCMGTEGRMPGQTFTFFQLVRMNLLVQFTISFYQLNFRWDDLLCGSCGCPVQCWGPESAALLRYATTHLKSCYFVDPVLSCAGHTQDIRCMSVHPNKLLIATGQGAGVDRAHVRWPYKRHIDMWLS